MKNELLTYPLNEKVRQALKKQVIEKIKEVYDPELPVNIYDLCLIRDVCVEASGIVYIKMTLTTPGCPEAQSLPRSVEKKANEVAGVIETQVDLVWNPPWSIEDLSEAARLQLGLI